MVKKLNLEVKPNLVVLGVKVNSWAWGLERIYQLANSKNPLVVMDLGSLPNQKISTARDIFQKSILN